MNMPSGLVISKSQPETRRSAAIHSPSSSEFLRLAAWRKQVDHQPRALTISMVIDSAFIFPSPHPLAEAHVCERYRKEKNRHRQKDRILHRKSPLP
jgi:hypothetical protein